MKYSKEERLAIGKKIYNNEITKYEAAEKYDINVNCARDYMRIYRDTNSLPAKGHSKEIRKARIIEITKVPEYKEYESMTREDV